MNRLNADDMRITEIRVHARTLPVQGSYRMGHGQVHSLDSTIVEVVTGNGTVGYGETCPSGTIYQPQHALGARAALAEIAPPLIGHDARALRPARELMDGVLAGHSYAKAAIDIALWDILGKAVGLRVCDLLGGALSERVPSYHVIDIAVPDEAARQATELQAQGFKRIQLKVGGRGVEEDIETIRKVSQELHPGVRLAVDANRTWTSAEAITASRLCDDIMFVLEQPCDSFEEIAAVRGRARHPIFLDESITDLRALTRAIAERLVDGFGLKLTRAGGLSGFRALRDVCEAHNLPHTCDDTWGGDITAAACVHLAATVRPGLLEGTWIAEPYIAEHYDPKSGIRIDHGSIEVPKGPGLGVVPDMTEWGPALATYV